MAWFLLYISIQRSPGHNGKGVTPRLILTFTQELIMLTEIDIKRIMEAKNHLTETLSEPVEYVLLDNNEIFEMPDNELSIYELQGAI